MISGSSDESLVPDTTPLYQNQLEDPECSALYDKDWFDPPE